MTENIVRSVSTRPSLVDNTLRQRVARKFVAVTKHGYGIDESAYNALLLCAEKFPLNLHHKPVQVAIYIVPDGVEPNKSGDWPNGHAPKLVGLMALNRKGTR